MIVEEFLRYFCLIKKKEGNNISIRRMHASPVSQSQKPFIRTPNFNSNSACFLPPDSHAMRPLDRAMNRIFLDMTCLLLRPSCHPHSSPTSRVGQNPPPPKCHSIPALLLAATKPNVYSSCSLSCYYTEGVDNHLCSQIMIARCQTEEKPRT